MANERRLTPEGFRIARARKIANVSQKELAKRLGVTSPMVSQWENGVRSPRHSTLLRIAEALNIDVRELIASKKPISDTGDTGYVLENTDQVNRYIDLLTYSSDVNSFFDICDKFGIAYIQSDDGETASFLNVHKVEPSEVLEMDSAQRIYREMQNYLIYQIIKNVHRLISS